MSEAARNLAAEIERLFRLLAARHGGLGDDEAGALTGTQRAALYALADEGPLRLGALAGRLGIPDPTATRLVDSLEAMGLVARARETEDRRAVRIGCTPQGSALVRRRRARLVHLLEEPLSHLDEDERAQVVGVLTDLNEALAGVTPARPGPR